MHPISTPDAPTPGGHYSQAIVHGGMVYVAGQLPIDPARPDAPPGTIEEQTERTLRNVEAILRAAGSGLDQVVQMTIYITARSQWAAVNATYARIMGHHRPARAIVPVKEIKPGCEIEIQAIAVAG
ncbi:MAG: Rid family detoxifying hydrolase [Gemmatimonadota bacterium]